MNTEALEYFKYVATVLSAGAAALTFLNKYREDPIFKYKNIVLKKAEYDIAIEYCKNDSFLSSMFEDLKKTNLIKNNTGILLVPEEIEAFVKFLKHGRVSTDQIKWAWQYKHFERDPDGNITALTFRLSWKDRFLLWFGNLYVSFCGIFSILCLFLFLVSRDPTFAVYSILCFCSVIVITLVMTNTLNHASSIEARMKGIK
jgi:hypothetical protein